MGFGLVEPVELAYFCGVFAHERAKNMWFSFDECETYSTSFWSRQIKASELLYNLISNVLVVGCRTLWIDFQQPGSDIKIVPGIWLGISVLF